MAKRKRSKRYFGNVRRLPSGRYQARYTGPDKRTYAARTPEGRPLTFDTQGDAEAWLALRQSEILRGAWLPPAEPAPSPTIIRAYATAWLPDRDIEDTTRDLYAGLLRDHIYPTFGDVAVGAVTPASVREWHAALRDTTGPTRRAHAYGLFRTIMNTAVTDEIIAANPCRIRGAGTVKRARNIRPASLPELETLVSALPARYRLMAMLAAWCALRFGELTELRRVDVDVTRRVLRIRRGAVRSKDRGAYVKGPKSEAGQRDVYIPPHLMSLVKAHLRRHTGEAVDALLFPSARDETKHMQPSTLHKVFDPARKTASRPDLRFHDLRHTGAVLAAATGATLAELMARLGHSTPDAAMVYQHAAAERDKVIAGQLSKLALPTRVRKSLRKRKETSK